MTKTIACALVLLSSSAFAARPDAWVMVRDHESVSMHGSSADLEAARSHLGALGPGYLWFRRDGKEYVVRGESLKEIDALAQQEETLGVEQGRLGKAQGELGRQQGELGREQGALGREQSRRAMRAGDGDDARELGERQRELGKAQAVLGREQAKLGKEQSKRGLQQRDLSRQMEQKIEQLIETALKNGSAKAI